jgi:hypothetical protein
LWCGATRSPTTKRSNTHESTYSCRVAFTLKPALHAPKARREAELRRKILGLVETAAQSDLCDGQTRMLKQIDSPLQAKVDEIGMRRLSHGFAERTGEIGRTQAAHAGKLRCGDGPIEMGAHVIGHPVEPARGKRLIGKVGLSRPGSNGAERGERQARARVNPL